MDRSFVWHGGQDDCCRCISARSASSSSPCNPLVAKGAHFAYPLGKVFLRCGPDDSVARGPQGRCRQQGKGGPMNEIAELERRIAYAMERIAKGLEGLDRPVAAVPVPPPPESVADRQEVEALRQALEEERLVNSQLEERLHALRQKHDD